MKAQTAPQYTKIRVLLSLIVLVFLAQPALAARQSGYSVEILVNGSPVREHLARGATYVEAVESAEYAVRLSNNTGERVAIALSIDGLNSIDAKTTSAKKASKWVLDPWETITVDGWQTDSKTARRFFFTTEDTSYGAWLGKTTNLGVIAAAVFREMPPPSRPWITRKQDRSSSGREAPKSAAPRPEMRQHECEEGLSDDLAATGIGRKVDNRVRRVRFVARSTPSATFSIRYEYRPQLVRLGVLPAPFKPLDRREQAQGFTDFDFAPDPYRR